MRARLIKPDYFKDEEVADLPPLARLLFVGLWCLADREGRLLDRPRMIRAEVLPYDNVDIDSLLDSLAGGQFIMRYQVGERRYIQIRTFLKHQQPHYKEPLSQLPAPDGVEGSPIVTTGVPTAQRQRILDRDGHKCTQCGATDDLTMDHITPRSKGGDGADDNLQTLCRRCNSSKNNRAAAQASADVGSSLAQASADVGSPMHPVTVTVTEAVTVPVPVTVSHSLRSCIAPAPEPTVDEQSTIDQEPSAGRVRPVPKPSSEPAPAAFLAFWSAYPRREARQAALAAWQKLRPPPETVAEIMAGLDRWQQSRQWLTDRVIPHPATWLNQRRWQDEPEPATTIRRTNGSTPHRRNEPATEAEIIAFRAAYEAGGH